jgi:biopolymer transport protein ExbB/biopolymer transport protein TolQ
MSGSLDLSSLGLSGSLSGTGIAVVAVLVLLSIWSLTVSVERLFVLARAKRQSRTFVRLASDHLSQGRTAAALAAAGKFPASPHARLAAAGLPLWSGQGLRGPRQQMTAERVREAAERAMERSSVVAAEDLGRGVASLATIATTAPFIGLFGTVVGIIHAFSQIGESGAGGFQVVSQGISEALVTTALGLVVAVPAAWMFNDLSGRVRRMSLDMASFSSELLELLPSEAGEAGA